MLAESLIRAQDKLIAERIDDRVYLRVETAPDKFTILNLSLDEAGEFAHGLEAVSRR